jgi:hypothetical protein
MIYWQRIAEKYSLNERDFEQLILNNEGKELQAKILEVHGIKLTMIQIGRIEESAGVV